VGEGFADVDAVEVPASGQVQATLPAGEVGGQEPVAGPVLKQRGRVQRRERVSVGPVVFAVSALGPDVRGRRFAAIDRWRRGALGPATW